MPSPAPAPRLPLEPTGRPLYQPPARIGCSGVSLVCLVALLAFAFGLQVIGPTISERIRTLPVAGVGVPAPTGTTEADLGSSTTPLPAPQLTPTLTEPVAVPTTPPVAPPTAPPPATATPAPGTAEFVAVGNTDGTGVYLRADPRSDGRRLVAVTEKTVLLIVGPDQTADDGRLWRNVRTLRDPAQTGWVLAQYLVPSSGP
ncbi:MAG: hypothetical protein M3Z04_08500 [Chloroflexota bacterium]|nr:hypothetical protein [Chloroflexota bacterium]